MLGASGTPLRLRMLARAATRPQHAASRFAVPSAAFYRPQQRFFGAEAQPSGFGLRPGEAPMTMVYGPADWNPEKKYEWDVMPRDSYGVPAHIPPDISTAVQHTYHIPPSYYPFIKKIGDDSPELKPWMDKLIKGQLTFHDYEEMFYHNCKPLKVYRKRLPVPYRTDHEMAQSEEVFWEGRWHHFRNQVFGEYAGIYVMRDFAISFVLGLWFCQLYMSSIYWYREDMKLFYLEAPEHKINWVVPRGDL